MTKQTTGERLNALRNRAGLTLADVARAGGYKGPSSVQAYFNADYDTFPLNAGVVRRLTRGMIGLGSPPITLAEVRELSELGEGDPFNRQTPTAVRKDYTESDVTPTLKGQPKDIPVFGSALAADLQFDVDGNGPGDVEQTIFDMGEIITHVRRPPAVSSQKVYALFVSGSSMEPRYRPGDPLFVDPARPPSIGDDVVVQLLSSDGTEIVTGLIKTLVRRTAGFLELEQYSPALRFRVPTDRIAHIHRVIPWREAFGM